MAKYICPMHPEIKSDEAGRCPKCGMELVLQEEAKSEVHQSTQEDVGLGSNYWPLIIIIGLIFITSLGVAYPKFDLRLIIRSFMAGFFLVFSGFKLIDLKGFAQGYSTYDLLAGRWFAYGYIYPLIELFFGLFMVLGWLSTTILIAEIVIMFFSGVGVLLKILKKERFQCVCLGTFLKVPLTKVTLVEDFGMASLALLMLVIR